MQHLEVSELADSQWDNLAAPDVYQTRPYNEVASLLERDTKRVTIVEISTASGTAFFPLIVRAIPGSDYADATSAYGYSGPWLEGTIEPDAISSGLDRWAADHNVVATFVRFNPLINNILHFSGALTISHVGPTAVWDVRPDRDLMANMHKSHRKTTRRAERAGVRTSIDLRPTDLADFQDLYESSMRRLKAAEYYRFPDTYWRALEESGEPLGTALIRASYDDELVAAALAISRPPYMNFHLSGTSQLGREIGAANLVRTKAAEWAQTKGIHWAHHGGGYGGEQSTLYQWKSRFDTSTPALAFHVARAIHNAHAYRLLAHEHPDTGYFPPWRAPARPYTA